MAGTECLQCQGEGGRWVPKHSPHNPNKPVEPRWQPCDYCKGTGVIDESEGLYEGVGSLLPEPLEEE